jgi:hypothetical protein
VKPEVVFWATLSAVALLLAARLWRNGGSADRVAAALILGAASWLANVQWATSSIENWKRISACKFIAYLVLFARDRNEVWRLELVLVQILVLVTHASFASADIHNPLVYGMYATALNLLFGWQLFTIAGGRETWGRWVR